MAHRGGRGRRVGGGRCAAVSDRHGKLVGRRVSARGRAAQQAAGIECEARWQSAGRDRPAERQIASRVAKAESIGMRCRRP